tara:strand:- start:22747 stop:23370 length:624 start_codon:yes stop_codon:yes gene_type:complete
MSNEQQNYYAVIPSYILNANDLTSDEKLLYALITSLSNEKGYCYASNSYFAKRFGKTDRSIKRWLQSLTSKSYVTSEVIYGEGTKQITSRYLRIARDVPRGRDKYDPRGRDKYVLDNNKDINNKGINIKKINKKKFVKPDLIDVEKYFFEKGYKANSKEFFDYYNENDWKGVKNWKQRAVTWESNNNRWLKTNDKKPMTLDQMGEDW